MVSLIEPYGNTEGSRSEVLAVSLLGESGRGIDPVETTR